MGWLLSLALAYGIGGVLAAAGIVLSFLYTGSALATTAIGTLIPVLRDTGDLRTRFGTYLLAAGAAGEFGPILLVTLILSGQNPAHETFILLAFVALAVAVAVVSVRSAWRGWPLLERTLESSSQLAVRLAVVLVFGLVALAGSLGLDVLLGGFVAGIVTRLALQGPRGGGARVQADRGRLRLPDPVLLRQQRHELRRGRARRPATLLKVPMFVALFLLVRGTPALLLYRGVLAARDRVALAFYSATELPLVVAITTIAVDQGHMRTSTAAALVGAAIISTAMFPFVGTGAAPRRSRPRRRPASRTPLRGCPASSRGPGPEAAEGGERVLAGQLPADRRARLGLHVGALRRLGADPLGERARVVVGGGADQQVLPAPHDRADALGLEPLGKLHRVPVGRQVHPHLPLGVAQLGGDSCRLLLLLARVLGGDLARRSAAAGPKRPPSAPRPDASAPPVRRPPASCWCSSTSRTARSAALRLLGRGRVEEHLRAVAGHDHAVARAARAAPARTRARAGSGRSGGCCPRPRTRP